MSSEERKLEFWGEWITLGQALKMASLIGTGGEAKHYLSVNKVLVNGEPEDRRGRKLHAGDLLNAPRTAPIRLAAQTAPREAE